MKLLQKQTETNEELMEENERFWKDQASLLHLLGQKDNQLKRTQIQREKWSQMSKNYIISTLRKFTYTKGIKRIFEKWKTLLFQKSREE